MGISKSYFCDKIFFYRKHNLLKHFGEDFMYVVCPPHKTLEQDFKTTIGIIIYNINNDKLALSLRGLYRFYKKYEYGYIHVYNFSTESSFFIEVDMGFLYNFCFDDILEKLDGDSLRDIRQLKCSHEYATRHITCIGDIITLFKWKILNKKVESQITSNSYI